MIIRNEDDFNEALKNLNNEFKHVNLADGMSVVFSECDMHEVGDMFDFMAETVESFADELEGENKDKFIHDCVYILNSNAELLEAINTYNDELHIDENIDCDIKYREERFPYGVQNLRRFVNYQRDDGQELNADIEL